MVDIFEEKKPIAFNSLSKDDQNLLKEIMKEEQKKSRADQKQQRALRKEELRKMYEGGEVSRPTKIEIPIFNHRRFNVYNK